jgi:hypothetical protein
VKTRFRLNIVCALPPRIRYVTEPLRKGVAFWYVYYICVYISVFKYNLSCGAPGNGHDVDLAEVPRRRLTQPAIRHLNPRKGQDGEIGGSRVQW